MHRRIILTIVMLLGLTQMATAQNIDTIAKNAYMLDAETGTILLDKNSNMPFPPASMSKLMTIYMAFDQLREGNIGLEDEVTVSREQWRRLNNLGSTMFLGSGDTVTVHDLLRGIIVLSGNDAAVVLAEYIGDDETAFAGWMNDKAAELGMKNSHFVNAHGLPAEGHQMSARDLAILAQAMVTEFPEYYKMFGEKTYLYKNFTGNMYNRNPLLGRFEGADGLKTGHTDEAGYCLTASAERDGRRVILVLAGMGSKAERQRESQKLMSQAFRNFSNYSLFKAGETVDSVDVWLGQDEIVPLVIEEDVKLTMTRRQNSGMKVTLEYMSPIPAPIAKGQPIATLTVSAPTMEDKKFELVAGKAVEEVSGFGRLGSALSYMLFGATPTPVSQ